MKTRNESLDTTSIFKKTLLAVSLAGGLAACAGNSPQESASASAENTAQIAAIEARQAELQRREEELAAREAQLTSDSMMTSSSNFSPAGDLLPPNAKTGECYARVWVEPTYMTESENVLVREASEKINFIPAKYEWTDESVLVKEASSTLKSIPAVYGSETETLQVKAESNSWRIDRSLSSAPASDKLLAAAQAGGINLDGSSPGMCYHEHFVPAQYQTVTEQVLSSEASTKIETIPAEYEWVEERVLVSEASYRMEEVPAAYETVSETVVDVPAHTIWKKGTGPIQRIDEATGEIMCLVEVPATYKTITKRVLKSGPTTRRVEIPAQYEMVKVRKLVSSPSQRTVEIPASYDTVSRQEKIADASFVWHEISDTSMSAESRTGAKLCLVNEPAQYKNVTRKVVRTPASVEEIEIPAVYETVKVKKLVSEAQEERIAIPAEYRTVTHQKLVKDGSMEWRSILCETNMTRSRISSIQQALVNEGYDPGPVDGVIGAQTIEAVNAFQRAKGLPVDKYLNMATIEALGVSVQ